MSDFKLHHSQSYVRALADQLGYRAELVEHQQRSDTCEERAAVLGISAQHIARALYFSSGARYIGVVVPGSQERVDQRSLFARVLQMSKSQAAKYCLKSDRTPQGMSFGTCTPFPHEESVGHEIDHLLVWNGLEHGTVYSAVGGEDELAHRISLAMPSYRAVYNVLVTQFGGDVVKPITQL